MSLLRRYALAASVGVPALAAAQPATPTADDQPTLHHAQLRVGYENTTLPGRERMGLTGASYLIEGLPGLYVGPAVYGALTGQRGGLFVVGAEAEWRQRLWRSLGLEAGLYVGGGGGAAAPVGGGLMVRPHADLLWDFGGWRAGLSYSRVRFPGGDIDSSQWGLVWSLDTGFETLRPDAGTTNGRSRRSGMGFDRVLGVGTAYLPSDGAQLRSGGRMRQRVGLVGARFETFVTPLLYWGIETAGAASGGVGGYAELLGSVGAETAVWGDTLTVGARAALGMGGGGDVSTGGGALGKGGVYVAMQLAPGVALALEGGLVRTHGADFQARYAALSLNLDLDHHGRPSPRDSVMRTEWIGGIEQYEAARRDGSERNLRNVVLKVNRYVGESVYITGQARSAYDGGAGGYTVGLIGVGWHGPRWRGMSAGVELAVGAGGGGGVDSGGGALIEPNAFVALDLGSDWSARLGAGYIRVSDGRLTSPTWELSLAYSFGVQGRP
jgi:hypothetical protein